MTAPASARPRPYFLPPSIDVDQWPAEVRAAFDALIQPAYEELVLMGISAIEKAAGMSVVFLLTEELLDQFDLAKSSALAQPTACSDREARENAFRRHLRLVGAKQAAINCLIRVRNLPWNGPWEPPLTSE